MKTDLKNIKGCKACKACYSKGAACVFDDDFNEIAPLMENADVIVMATPVYWYTFPAQLKAANPWADVAGRAGWVLLGISLVLRFTGVA